MNNFNSAFTKARTQARLHRGMYLLPSLFTVGNIAAGFFSITETIKATSGAGNAQSHLDWAAIAILFAIPFDLFDGRIARMTNTTTEFGKELDSLADAITFGVAPSLLALIWGFHFLSDSINLQLRQHLEQAGAFICFLFLIGGVSRLARFNISHDAQPRNPGRPGRKYFVGMPIPAAAGLLAATVHFFYAAATSSTPPAPRYQRTCRSIQSRKTRHSNNERRHKRQGPAQQAVGKDGCAKS